MAGSARLASTLLHDSLQKEVSIHKIGGQIQWLAAYFYRSHDTQASRTSSVGTERPFGT